MRRSQTPVEGASQDPGLTALRVWLAPFAFCVVHRIGLHNFAAFGAPCRRPYTRCLRFAAALADGPRKTRFRPVVPALTGWDLHPRVALKGFCRYIASPFPRLSWRKDETASRWRETRACHPDCLFDVVDLVRDVPPVVPASPADACHERTSLFTLARPSLWGSPASPTDLGSAPPVSRKLLFFSSLRTIPIDDHDACSAASSNRFLTESRSPPELVRRWSLRDSAKNLIHTVNLRLLSAHFRTRAGLLGASR